MLTTYNPNGHRAAFTFHASDRDFLKNLSEASAIWSIAYLETRITITYTKEGKTVTRSCDRLIEMHYCILAEFSDDESEDDLEIPIEAIQSVTLHIQ